MIKGIMAWAHEMSVFFLAALVMGAVAGIAADIWPDDAETNNLSIGFVFGMVTWMAVEKMRK